MGKFRHGRNVLVFGAGPIGLLCAAVAKALGATEIVVVDIDSSRLEFAKQYAATGTFLPPSQEKDEKKMDYAKRVVQQLFSNWQPVARGLRDALLTKTKRPRIRSQAERATRVTRAASHNEEPIADEDARLRDAKEG